jgi:YfiR/HmsC-like
MNKKIIWLLLICILGTFGSLRAGEISHEYRVKAAFLVNFARFISWPEDSFSPDRRELTLCVAGNNPFVAALKAVEGKQINGRKLRIIYVDSLRKVPQCHMLYVSRSEQHDLDYLSTGIGRQPVVTVSDIPGFVKSGGSIEFVQKVNRLSFIINNSALRQRGIRADASMLDLAVSVR